MSTLTVIRIAVLVAGPVLLVMIMTRMTQSFPGVSRKLLQWGARHCFATDSLRERFEEEWLADLDDVPGRLTKLAHCVGVLLFTVAPLWARSRWERSQLAERLNTVKARLCPPSAVVNGAGGAALARACAVALSLAVTGLVAVLSAQGTLRILQITAAPSGASSASGVTGVSGQWYRTAVAANGSGEAAVVEIGSMPWGTELLAKVVGIPVGTMVRLYVISTGGKHYLAGTWTEDAQENSVWYPTGTALAASAIKSLEVTAATAPPVVISPPQPVAPGGP